MKIKYVAILLSLSLLAGCGSANANTTAPSEPTATEQQSELVETETTVEAETTVETESTVETETTATEVTTETVEKEVISDYIFDYEFLYNGKKVTLPMSYKEFSEITGWSIEESQLKGVDEKFVMSESMDIEGFHIANPKYPDAFNSFGGYAGFQNLSDERLHVTETSVCRVSFGIYYNYEPLPFGDDDREASSGLVESWDEIELSKGITWGSTVEEILAAYDEIEKCFVNEVADGVTRIFYRDPDGKGGDYKVIEFYVHDEYGLTSFEYSNQKDPT